jgi:phosphopantothenoylcysteine decarboxylase
LAFNRPPPYPLSPIPYPLSPAPCPLPMNGRELLIGVTGGIAAFKTAALVSKLVQAGAGVSVVMTKSATQLVGPKTFEALTGRPVGVKVFGRGAHPHIEAAQKAELFCIAPATANILAKTACGLADDLVSTVYLAFDGPVLMAPAMNAKMWEKPAVKRNLEQLRADGVILIDPGEGRLSCGDIGAGRMAEPEEIIRVIAEQLKKVR